MKRREFLAATGVAAIAATSADLFKAAAIAEDGMPIAAGMNRQETLKRATLVHGSQTMSLRSVKVGDVCSGSVFLTDDRVIVHQVEHDADGFRGILYRTASEALGFLGAVPEDMVATWRHAQENPSSLISDALPLPKQEVGQLKNLAGLQEAGRRKNPAFNVLLGCCTGKELIQIHPEELTRTSALKDLRRGDICSGPVFLTKDKVMITKIDGLNFDFETEKGEAGFVGLNIGSAENISVTVYPGYQYKWSPSSSQ